MEKDIAKILGKKNTTKELLIKNKIRENKPTNNLKEEQWLQYMLEHKKYIF